MHRLGDRAPLDPARLACGAVREHPMTVICGHSRATQTIAVLNRRFAQPVARPQQSDRAPIHAPDRRERLGALWPE
ncbi:MAG: hypothetical protein MI924_10785 [Chloroflexales bacterium]|nr:hypothetical protein [Chloroflexales bacterium]